MFKTDREVIIYALTMWQNYIQTGDVLQNPDDAKNCGESKKIKSLTIDQMEFLVRIEKIKQKLKQNI